MMRSNFKKPIIGITSNFSTSSQIGSITNLGLSSQQWQLLADDYVKAVELSGGIPVIIPITEDEESAAQILNILDGLILTGGNDVNPLLYNHSRSSSSGEISIRRDTIELSILKRALSEYDIPIMGICRGCQLLNVSKGGTLYQDLISEGMTKNEHLLVCYPKEYGSQIANIYEESRLYKIMQSNEIKINSLHSQGVKAVGEDMVVTVKSSDGVVEAIEQVGERFVIGVQWHPEMMIEKDINSQRLFKAFINECRI